MSLNKNRFEKLQAQTPAIRAVLDDAGSVPLDMLKEFAAVCHIGLLAHIERLPQYHESVSEALEWIEFATDVLNNGTGKDWAAISKGVHSQFGTQRRLIKGQETSSSKPPREHMMSMLKEWEPRVLERLVDVDRDIIAKFATVSCVGLMSVFTWAKDRRTQIGKRCAKWLDKAMDVLNEGRAEGAELEGWHSGYILPSKRKEPASTDLGKVIEMQVSPDVRWAREWAAGGHKKEPLRKAEALKILAFNYQAFTDKERQAILLAYHSQTEQGSLL